MKKAIIIGASSGIGKELAITLAKNGYEVGLMARRTELLEALKNEIPTKTQVGHIDLSKIPEVVEKFQNMIQAMQSLDWLDRVGGFDEDYGFQTLLNSIDALIIGRKTYEVATMVPDPYPGKRVVVLSKSLNSVRKGMELYRGDLTQLASRLHSDRVKHIWVDGGMTISQFLDLQMVDSMTLSLIPLILGAGISLFNPIGKEQACRLISSQSYPSGLVQLTYEMKQTEVLLNDKSTR